MVPLIAKLCYFDIKLILWLGWFTKNNTMHIIVIEDEIILSQNLEKTLSKQWYEVEILSSYKDFTNYTKLHEADLFLIDISLWDGSWIDAVKIIKKSKLTKHIPVILISWHSEVHVKVAWLNYWANDYLVKPFNNEELLARIHVSLRQKYPETSSSTLVHNNIIFETASRKVLKSWKEIKLSKKEKQLLEHFILNPWVCISKKSLQEMFWKNSGKYTILDNTINVTVCKLRKKIWKDFLLETIVWEWYSLIKI